MIQVIIAIAIGVGIGGLITALFLSPKLKRVTVDNQSILKENSQLQLTRTKYTEEISQMEKTIGELNLQREKLLAQVEQINSSLEKQKEQADKTNEIIYQQSFELMQEKLEKAADEESEKFQKAQQEAENEYLLCLREQAKDFQIALEENAEKLAEKQTEIKNVEEQLIVLQKKFRAAIEVAKREELLKQNPEYYCIQLEKADKIDIARMIEFSETLNNPRALLMCIWTNFIRTPLRTLCNNVFGINEICGIYKISINDQVYIGQSIHCKERIAEHFKKALGIDTPITNKLYAYLRKHNIWDIRVEFLEECKPEELNDREKFFIELLSADKSLNSTAGNRG